jgi:Tol biopolymer transport system component
VFEIDLATGTVRQLNPRSEQARYEAITYTPDGKSLLVNTDFGSDFMHVAQIDLDTLHVETVVAQEHDLEWMTLSPDGRFIAYTASVDGATTLYLFDRSSGAIKIAPALSNAPGVMGF